MLVTGAAGFIGSHVCQVLSDRGVEVRAVDCFLPDSYAAADKVRTWREVAVLPGVEAVEMDLRTGDVAGVVDGVDVIVNEAAMPGLMKSWSDFDLYSGCNISVVQRLARAAAASGAHVVQASTSSVYGADAVGDESTRTAPISPYGVTKLAAEELLHAYGRGYGLGYTILRYFSVYGPRQRPDMAYRLMIDAVLRGQEIEVFGDGLQSRSNTFVLDCADATVAAVERRPQGEVINIAGAASTTLLDAVGHIEQIAGRKARLEHRPARPGDQRHTGGAIGKARRLLDWEPSVTLRDGLGEQVAWQRSLGVDE